MSSKIMMKKGVLNLCRTGILCAVALVLSVVENMIPVLPFSMPGMKLGLSNIVVMFSIEICSLPASLSIVAVKALFSLISRGAVAFMMSFTGGLLSFFAMFLLIRWRKPVFGCLGVGIGGAFMHNMGQFFVACFMMGDSVLWYLPVLCTSALATGMLTALVCYVVMPPIKRIPFIKDH